MLLPALIARRTDAAIAAARRRPARARRARRPRLAHAGRAVGRRSSSGCRSPARCCWSPSCCSPTSRPATSTRAAAARSWASCASLNRAEGRTIVMVTHDPVGRRGRRSRRVPARRPRRRRGAGRLDAARQRVLRDARAAREVRDAGGLSVDAALVRRPRRPPAAQPAAAGGADRVRRRARRRDGVRRPAARRHDPPHVRRPDRLRLGQDRPRRLGTANGGMLPQSALDRVRAVPGVRDAAPMVGGAVHAARRARARRRGAAGRACSSPATTPRRYAAVRLPLASRARPPRTGPEIARRAQLGARARHRRSAIASASRRRPGRAGCRVSASSASRAGCRSAAAGFAAMPIGAARRLIGSADGLLPGQHRGRRQRRRRGRAAARRQPRSARGADVKTPAGLSDEVSQQLDALNVVLYFFSGIALFVGGFLILNSFNMTVLQRMRELGTLRTLGASRGLRHAHDPRSRRADRRGRQRCSASGSGSALAAG